MITRKQPLNYIIMASEQNNELQIQLAARFKQLPVVIQNAITSADVEQHLRALADTNKLHLDQWEILENEVMLTLMGFQKMEDLDKNIRESVDVTPEVARQLAHDISETIFAPIRGELERLLEHPDAQAATVSDVETARTEVLGQNTSRTITPAATPSLPAIIPATPPAPPPTDKAVRANPSPMYTPQAPSQERKGIAGDPYREQVG